MSHGTEVLRVRYPDLKVFYRDAFHANKPAVIEGVTKHHDLELFRWTLPRLRDAIGDREYSVMRTTTGFLSYERDVEPMGFSSFANLASRQVEPGGAKYYFKNPTKLLPGGLDDSDGITGLSTFYNKSVVRNVWISGPGLTVGLHYDPAENLNMQVRGRKRFVLYPPGTSSYYPLPFFSQTAHISGVFREGPELDAKRFPKFRPETAVEIVLEEGEILYLPPYWWHQVTSLGDENINLNTWSFPSLRKQLMNPGQAARGHCQVLTRLIRYGNIQQAPSQAKARAT